MNIVVIRMNIANIHANNGIIRMNIAKKHLNNDNIQNNNAVLFYITG